MSERKAKNQRKEAPQSAGHGAAKSKINGMSIIMVLIVVAVLALGAYAVGSAYLEKKANQPAGDAQNTVQTVAQYAEENGTTAEEFMTTYGLDGVEEVNADTDINTASGHMTLEKFAQFSGKDVTALKEEYGLGENVTNDMKWSDAQGYVPVGVVCRQSGIDYNEFLASYNLTEEELPSDTPWSEAITIMNEAAQKTQAEATASPEATTEPEAE